MHRPKKRYSQNFLTDRHVIERIVQAIHPAREQRLVEIGPGLGALTAEILATTDHLDVIEIDRDVIPKLIERCQATPQQLTIHQTDALTFDFSQLAQQPRSLRIFGNLPYHISTPLIFHLLEQREWIADLHFMLQKEVVERMHAAPGSKVYGRLSVMVQYFCKVEPLFTVGRHAFHPAPQVESKVVRLIPIHDPQPAAQNLKHFTDIVREAFNHRRKTLHNCLKHMLPPSIWDATGINPGLRPEVLSVTEFVHLSNTALNLATH